MIEVIGVNTKGGVVAPHEIVIWADPTLSVGHMEQMQVSGRLVVDGLKAVVGDKAQNVAELHRKLSYVNGSHDLYQADPNEAKRLSAEIADAKGEKHAFELLASVVDADLFNHGEVYTGGFINYSYAGAYRVPLLVAGAMRGMRDVARSRGLNTKSATEFYRSHLMHTVVEPDQLTQYRNKFSPYRYSTTA